MRLVLTNKEIVALGEYALKCHHVSGALLVQAEQVICTEILAMTDKELLDEMTLKAIASIETIGGSVMVTSYGEYMVHIPESFVLDQFDKSNKVTVAVMPLMLKAYKFGKKYANYFIGLIEKLRTYEIFKVGFYKELSNDINDLQEELVKSELKIDKIMRG